ncbi:MAG: hypothetical protein EGQ86_20175 [Alistipes sp.]|nr:hypothetical protein [Alistipes sp.]MBE5689749.1 hypothetical protein [Alistipes sp.]
MVSGSFIIAIAVECVVVGSGSAERANPPRLRCRAPSGCFFVFSDAPGQPFRFRLSETRDFPVVFRVRRGFEIRKPACRSKSRLKIQS